MISLEDAETSARTIAGEHKDAIDNSEKTGEDLARKSAAYHKAVAIAIPVESATWGKTVAEAMAKGTDDVQKALVERDIAAVKDRAAMERVRLARDDRSALLALNARSQAESF